MKRIYSVDLLKTIFAYLIAYFHIGIYLPGASIAVVFFLILSGFFLARKFYSKLKRGENGTYNGFSYTVDHIKSLYPHYIFSLLMLFLYLVVAMDSYSVYPIAEKAYDLIPELLLVQNIGFFNGGINYPLWQVSILVICGYFIYTLLHLNESLSISLIFPLGIILIQAFLGTGVDQFGTVGFFYVPLLRAFSALAIGVLIYRFTLSECYKKVIKQYPVFWNVASIISLILLFVFGSRNNIYIILSAFIIIGLMEQNSWLNRILNRQCFKFCGEYSYAIYLNHALVICFINDNRERIFSILSVEATEVNVGVLYGLILTIYSVMTTIFIKYMRKKFIERHEEGEFK